MRIRTALILAAFAACIGLPASPAPAQVGNDQPLNADGMPIFFEPEVARCCKATAFESGAPSNWQPGQLLPGARFNPRGPGGDPTDVLNNHLSIEVSPPGSSITGSNVMTIKSNVDNLTSFTFMLRCHYTVTFCRITYANGSHDDLATLPNPLCPSPVTSYARTITIPQPISAGQIFTIQIDYTGNMITGLGLSPGSVVFRYQNNGSSSNPGVICTLSEPYYAGTWWPCKDGDVRLNGDNSDKATLDMDITAPDTFQSVSNGLLVGVDTLSGNRKKYRWSTSYPLTTYLVFFSTSVYIQYALDYAYGPGQSLHMPVQFSIYSSPGNDTANNRAVWAKVPTMLATYETIYGLYPFINEKYGIYQFEFGGGQEHQTYTGQGGGGAFSESVTSHELGHQWWGDNITCKTWSDIWLNEGFADYTECLWEERKPQPNNQPPLGLPGLKAAINARKPSASAIASASSTVYVTPYDPSNGITTNTTGDPNRIFNGSYTYYKGGWVVHMLRHVMGDANFFNGLQAYRAAYQLGSATTSQFAAVMSSVYGSDLSWFFNEWIYLPGAPTYTFAWANATINGQTYLRLSVAQTQASPPAPLFTMPMDVQITTPSGVINTSVRTHSGIDTLNMNARIPDDFLIPIPAAATAVVIDPDDWILNYGKTLVATYVQGPPKVVATTPLPGASIPVASSPSSLTIVFSDAVNISAANIGVTRSAVSVPFTFAYSPTSLTATLTFSGPLAAGTYNVAVSDAITATANAQRLDGELASNTPAALPSGEGAPMGSALYSFTITAPPCPADFNGIGGVNVADIFAYLSAWFAQSGQTGPGLTADFNHDNVVNVADIFAFLGAWFTVCP